MELDQFRNADVGRWPQEVRIEFEREIIDDPDPDLSWLEPDDEKSAEDAARDAERLASYGDSWGMIGIRAKAIIWVPIGGNSFTRYELTSAGLWGTESDSDEDYKNSIFEEEKAELVRAMKLMGAAVET